MDDRDEWCVCVYVCVCVCVRERERERDERESGKFVLAAGHDDDNELNGKAAESVIDMKFTLLWINPDH